MLRLLCLSLFLGVVLADDSHLVEDLIRILKAEDSLRSRSGHGEDGNKPFPRQTEEVHSSVREDILIQLDKYKKCVKDHDLDGVQALYVPNAIVMLEKFNTLDGMDEVAFRKALDWIFDTAEMRVQVEQIQAMDEAGKYVLMRSEYQLIDSSGDTIQNGKGLTIWKKTSDGYKIYIDMDNDNPSD